MNQCTQEPNTLVNDVLPALLHLSEKFKNFETQWNSFKSEVIKFSTKISILICGDMNVRTGTLCDYVQNDFDIFIPFLFVMTLKMNFNTHPWTCQLIYISNRLKILNG